MLYNNVMKISLKCNLKPAVPTFHFLPPSYNTLLSYGAKFLYNVWFHGRILCMDADTYKADDLCVSIFCLFFSKTVSCLCKFPVLPQFFKI